MIVHVLFLGPWFVNAAELKGLHRPPRRDLDLLNYCSCALAGL